MEEKEHHPPGPSGWPFVGQLIAYRRDPIDFLMRLAKEYGDIVSFRIGSQQMILLNHPDYIGQVLTTDHRSFIKGRGLQWAKRLLGEGLLTSEGEFHRRQRRIMQPAFHRRRIATYGEAMTAHTVEARERWKEGTPFDIAEEMMRLTLAVAAKTLFDTDVESEAREIGEALSVSVELFPRYTFPFANLLAELPIPPTLRFRKAKARLDETIYRMIAERRADGKDRGDLLSMLLLAQDEEGGTGGMTDQELRDEVMTILIAGHETTANALTWTWYLLSQYPDIRSRFHAEVDAVLGGRLPGVDDLPKLSYVEKVFAESMRLSGVAARIPSDRRRPNRRVYDPGRIGGFNEPVCHAPRPSIFPRSIPVRPGALDSRVEGGPSQVFLLPLRRRSPRLHRRTVCLDGRGSDSRHPCPTVGSLTGSGTSGGASAVDHVATETGDLDDRQAAMIGGFLFYFFLSIARIIRRNIARNSLTSSKSASARMKIFRNLLVMVLLAGLCVLSAGFRKPIASKACSIS
ncbi:MAG: cytochrome P450 [Candidatus Manganitrophaceae bacterium]